MESILHEGSLLQEESVLHEDTFAQVEKSFSVFFTLIIKNFFIIITKTPNPYPRLVIFSFFPVFFIIYSLIIFLFSRFFLITNFYKLFLIILLSLLPLTLTRSVTFFLVYIYLFYNFFFLLKIFCYLFLLSLLLLTLSR